MNRLIIIGNGFDLAHGLKTDYGSFLKWYVQKVFKNIVYNKEKDKYEYDDELVNVENSFEDFNYSHFGNNISNVTNFVEHLFTDEFFFESIIYGNNINYDFIAMKSSDGERYDSNIKNPFIVKTKSKLLFNILSKNVLNNFRWVDIENIYYDLLTSLLNKENRAIVGIEELNKDFNYLIQQLQEYLQTVPKPLKIEGYEDIFYESIPTIETFGEGSPINGIPGKNIGKIQFLNFNYTDTPELYLQTQKKHYNFKSLFSVNYIHGRLNDAENKIIFGFGDEHDDNYKKMEELNDNRYFEFIKSFGYFKTSNYEELISFLEGNKFQVYILGHSCGLSDRTMLKMIFEHDNCKSIRIFYHKTENDFIDKTQNISRHFNNKVKMRERIVNFKKLKPMPQANT